MKYKNQKNGIFRSKFEQTCAAKLEEAGINYEYEPYAITLVDAFVTKTTSWERARKQFTERSNKIRPITYTPDFVGANWIIEIKGMRTPDFDLKWKLLKLKFKNNKRMRLFLPQNLRELDASIELIKHGKLLQNKSNL